MARNPDLDMQTGQLVKALEPALRSHLGVEGLERQFVTEIYWRVRQCLLDCGGLASTSSVQCLDPQNLALKVYLTATTYLEGGKVTPDLLSSLRGALEAAIEDLSSERDPMNRDSREEKLS